MAETLLRIELLYPLVGVVAGAATTVGLHLRERKKASTLPFLPSYEAALDREDAYTRFFAAAHDVTMCVTEAWNASNARIRRGDVEALVDRSRLTAASERLTTAEGEVRDKLKPYRDAVGLLQSALKALDACWLYHWEDQYRTETYTTTSRDANGNTTFQTRTRQVYESTTHSWEFYPQAARKAELAVRALLADVDEDTLPRADLEGVGLDITQLSDGERMFLQRLVRDTVLEDPTAEVSEEEAALYAHQWLVGNDLDNQLDIIRRSLANTRAQQTRRFETLAGGASHAETTHTPGPTEGPPAYQASTGLSAHIRNATEAWATLNQMFHDTVQTAKRLVDYATDNETVEADRDYAEQAIEAYTQAFPHSALELDQLTRPGRSVLIGLAVAVAAGLLSWLVGSAAVE